MASCYNQLLTSSVSFLLAEFCNVNRCNINYNFAKGNFLEFPLLAYFPLLALTLYKSAYYTEKYIWV